MVMNRFLKAFPLVAVMGLGALAAQKPNVVVILADDLGYGDLGCYGATKVKTPNIDAFAQQGVRFTDAHSPSGVCQPSRYAVMAGRYNWRRGKPWDGTYMFSEKHPTLQQMLGKAGYDTVMFGKWHNGIGHGPVDFNKTLNPGPLDSGFDYFFGTPRSHNEPPQVFVENDRVVALDPNDPLRIIEHKEVEERGLKDWGWGLSEGAAAAHKARPEDEIDLIVAERAADYLKKRSKKTPLFLYVAFVAPHVPLSPSEQFKGTSEAGVYGDFLQQLDAAMGTVLKALKNNGYDKNTLVIFTSDNGAVYMRSAVETGHRQNGELLGQKTDAWCGGNQVPFIVRWPGKIPMNRTSDAFMSHTDVMATVSAATGVPLPKGAAEDSLNQWPVWTNPSGESIRNEMVYTGIFGQGLYYKGWVYYPFQGSGGMTAHPTQVWGQSYKSTGMTNSDHHADGTLRANAPGAQLYNVKSDPGQTTNVYGQNPERISAMKARLDALIGPPKTPPGDGSTFSTSSNATKKAPVSWNNAVWGNPAQVPMSGNHYVHDQKDVWLLALGTNGPFPGKTLTLKNDASIWLTGGGMLGKGQLILDGGQIQNRYSGRNAVLLGRVRVDAPSKILNIDGSLELKAGLSGEGDLSLSAFQQAGTSVIISGADQGYTGTFVLSDSAADEVALDVDFATAFPKAGLNFESRNSSRMPMLALKETLRFAEVSMPGENGGMVKLPNGTYRADDLKAAGVSGLAYRNLEGTLIVGK